MGNCCETERESTPKPEPPSSTATKPSTLNIPFSNHVSADAPSPALPRRSNKGQSPVLAQFSGQATALPTSTAQAETGFQKATVGRRMLKLRTVFSVHFEVVRELHRDQFCVVRLMEQKLTHRQAVIKKVDTRGNESAGAIVNQELAVDSRLDHPNVLKTVEVYYDGRAIYMISEMLLSDPVLDFASIRHLSQSTALKIGYQVLTTLKYCHPKLIPHLNISTETLLVQTGSTNGESLIKLAGFGSRPSQDPASALFKAPELLRGLPGSDKADIWACGVLLFYLLCKEMPFHDTDEVLSGKPKFKQVYWEKKGVNARILISTMLDLEASARPSASQCMSHSLFHSPAFEVPAEPSFLCPSLDGLRTAVPMDELTRAVVSYVSSFVRDSGYIKSMMADFKALDTDEDGEISLSELIEGYVKTGLDREEAAIVGKSVLQTVGTAQSGVITYSEFLFAHADLATLLSRENLRHVYAALHASAGTQPRLKDLQVHIRGQREENTRKRWQELWEKHGFHKDKRLACEDFVELLQNGNIAALE